jgi:hypothetical protein
MPRGALHVFPVELPKFCLGPLDLMRKVLCKSPRIWRCRRSLHLSATPPTRLVPTQPTTVPGMGLAISSLRLETPNALHAVVKQLFA